MKVDTKAQVPLTGNKMGKTEGSRAPGGSPKDRIGLKASNVAVQTDKKDLWDLIARLKRTLVSQTGSQSPGRESIETKLIPFLSLLESAERVPGNSDLKLAEKFLSLWMEKHRGLLPPRIKKSLSELESLLRSQNVRDNHLYVLTGQDEGAEGKKWRLRVDPEHCRNGREEDDENCEQWRFDFFSDHLGAIGVILEERSGIRTCSFASSEEVVRRALKKSMKDLVSQLTRRGVEVPHLSVVSRKPENIDLTEKEKGNIDLWG